MSKRRKKKSVLGKLILVIILILCIVFAKNKYHIILKKDKNISNKNITNESATKSEEVKNPAKEILTENEVKNKKSLSIETPSGAVLVGIINKDSEGWYFMPEQPVNITLTYYIDHPEKFDNVIKLRMLSDDEDNFNKSLYINEIVTITGEILNPRSAGILYLYPYDIKTGKQVSKSYADESVKAPVSEFKEMDESLLPDKMSSKIVNGEYKYNFYMVSKETLYNFDNDFINFYLDFVYSFLNYETSISCPKKSYADYIFLILDYEFPVFYADGKYDYSLAYDEENKTLNWSYTSKNKSEHNKLIKEFEDEANKFLSGVKENQSESYKAQIIYHNLTPVITYDYEGFKNGKAEESYYVYTKHLGVCHSFAFTYSQLLTQVGIESTIATGMSSLSQMGHSWTVMKIDNEYYFSDPTYEIGFQNGTSYAFYGMGIKERERTNEYNEENIVIGKYNSKPISKYGKFENNLKIVSK